MTNPGDLDRCETHNSIEFMKEHPEIVFSRIPMKLADLFAPTTLMVRIFGGDYYRPRPEGVWRYGPMAVAILSYVLVVIGAVLSLTLVRTDRWTWWMLILIAYHVAIYAVTFGMSRYRITLEPFLVLMSVQGWRYGPGALIAQRGIGWRALAAYALLALVLFMWHTRMYTGPEQVLSYFF